MKVVSEIREWMQILLPMVNLSAILFGIIKVFNRHEREWKDKEMRLANVESDLRQMKSIESRLIAIETKASAMITEMERVRSRLDDFLDREVAK